MGGRVMGEGKGENGRGNLVERKGGMRKGGGRRESREGIDGRTE